MRVTEKGQVTIPIAIRHKLGINPGTEVEFIDEGASVKLVTSREKGRDLETFKRNLDRLAGSLDLNGMTTDEYMIWLRGERDDLGPR